MKIYNEIVKIKAQIREWKDKGYSIGLVPTMGYLHEGHKSLIDRAVKENDRVIVSIFVNPIQFGENEDFATYPRDLEKDSILCEKAGVNVIFNPTAEEMYPNRFYTKVSVATITEGLCGKTRPTHFDGVCTVVNKLFNIVEPNRAYFGQKDAQQLAVIKKMVADLNINIDIVGCPIIREESGLAKSSRNTYLSEEEKKAALILSKTLKEAREKIMSGNKKAEEIIKVAKEKISSEGLAKIDYVEVVAWPNLEKVENINEPILMALAVYIGKTRLIDNFIIE